MAEETKKPFEFKVTYFKPSGKWYTDCTWTCECQVLSNDPTHPYVYDAMDRLKELRDAGKLPGLQSGQWDGFVMFQFADSFPTLILPADLD